MISSTNRMAVAFLRSVVKRRRSMSCGCPLECATAKSWLRYLAGIGLCWSIKATIGTGPVPSMLFQPLTGGIGSLVGID